MAKEVSVHSDIEERRCQRRSNYSTIALIHHVSKVLLKIIQQRMNTIIERELPQEQAGFRKGRGTRDHIANLPLDHRKGQRIPEDQERMQAGLHTVTTSLHFPCRDDHEKCGGGGRQYRS